MKRNYAILAALTVCGVSACYGGSPPAAPAPPVVALPGTFGPASDTPADVANWWQKFNDPELNSLIERALKSNLNLQMADARIRQARAGVLSSQANGLPQFSGGGSLTHGGGPQATSTDPQVSKIISGNGAGIDNRNATLNMNWMRDFFGVNKNTTKAAKMEVIVADEDKHGIMVSLMGDVATDYMQLRGYQEQVEVAREAVEVRQDYLQLIKSKLTGGLVTDFDVSPLELDLTSTEATIPQMQASIEVLSHRLAVLTGAEPDALKEELLASAPVPAGPEEVPPGIPKDLVERRPDVRKAADEMSAAAARTAAARGERYPKFSLTGEYGARSQGLSAVKLGNAGGFFSLGPSITVPIFSFGKIRADIETEGAQQSQAELQYQQTVLQALQEVRDAMAKYSHENERKVELEQMVVTSQRKLNFARQMFDGGVQEYAPVLDAEEILVAAKAQLADSRENCAEDLVSLYRALGGGWN